MADRFVRPLRQQVGADSACRQSAARPQIRRIRELQSMVPGFVLYSAAAGGCRPGRPTAVGAGHCPVAANSRRQNPRQHVAVGTAGQAHFWLGS